MKKWKRGMSLVLAAAMVMGLSACGLFNRGNGGLGGNQTKNPNSELAKQYVYRMQEFDLSGVQESGTDTYVQNVMKSGDNLYMILMSYDYSEGSDGQTYRLVSMDQDGSNVKSYEMQNAMEGEENSSENEPAETENESEGSADIGYASEVYESTGLSGFQIYKDKVWGIKTYYYEDYSDPDNYVNIRRYYVCSWDLEGNMLRQSQLDLPEGESSWYNVVYVADAGNGSVTALINGSENGDTIAGKVTVNGEGEVSELQPIDGLQEILSNYNSISAMSDGRVMITYYDDNDWSKIYAVSYDTKKDQIGEAFPIPETVSYNMGSINLDANDDLLYTTSMGIFKYHIGDEDGVQVMSFVNSDLDISYLNAIYSIDDDHFVGLYSEYDEQNWVSTVAGGLFTRVPPEDIPDKTVLVLGGNNIYGDIRSRVIEYNKSSDTHRIVLKDYSQYIEADDYTAGITQMNNDIISGNMPDILIVDGYNMNLENYISKGLLADIGELIEKDEELSQKEYMENVFEACSVDGKLYEIIPSFSVRTYIGKKSLVGSPENWTMEDARRCLDAMPEGASIFGDMTRPEFFQIVMSMCGSDFIDVSTGKCNFDSQEFISLMEFAKELPQELGDDYYDDDWYVTYESQYRENRTLLANCSIYSLENMIYTINGTFGEDISFVGFPNEGGQGAVINAYETYALAAKGSDVDEAWNFMRYYLTDEYQETLQWELPINKKYFDELAEKATKKPTYEDEGGNLVEEDYTWWFNDETLILDPLTTEQAEEIKEYIASVDKRSYQNTDISNIIDEEMEAFYQGQKSAKDVAAVIQSRAQVFVNENR